MLNFAEVNQLTEECYAPGSLGIFNLQLQVTVQNNQNVTWNGNEYELIIMVMNSGVFVNERGTSSTFLGLLTKQDVLDSLQQQPYSSNEVRRMVGGGLPGQHPLSNGLDPGQAACGQGCLGARAPPIRSDRR